MPINNAQLRAFNAVAQEGSFTGAAKAGNVTQPTLSGQVKELEERFEVKLFERRSRRIELTDLGHALFEITQRRFALESEAEQLLIAARELVTGNLRVGADAPYHVVPLIANFNRRYPGVRLTFEFGNTADVMAALLERACDIAVLPDIPGDPRLHTQLLLRDKLIVFTNRAHEWAGRRSIKFAELPTQRVLLRGAGSATRAALERSLDEAGLKLESTLEIGSREAVREGVAAGLGVGVVLSSEFGADERLHALAVRDKQLKGSEYVACLTKKRQDRVVKAFFELLPGGG